MSIGLSPEVGVDHSSALSQPGVFRHLIRDPAVVAPLVFILLLVLASIFAPLIAPYDPRSQDLLNALKGPSWHHLLGTDTLGRDEFSRILYGGDRSLVSVAEAVSVVLVVGVPLGLIAGYFGGAADWVLNRIVDLLLAVPGIIIVFVVLAVIPGSEDVAMITIGILGVPVVLRVVRAATLRVREDQYVAAARVSGLSHARIIARHVLPRVIGPIVVQASLFAAGALLAETGFAYLGVTSSASTPTWGGMMGEAATVLQQQEWLLVPSGLVIALTILAFGLLGDGLRDALIVEERIQSTPRRVRPRTVRADSEPTGLRPRAANDRLLEVHDLTVALTNGPNEVLVVEGVSFDVGAGETVGLIGESGCGKSVTALALLRLLPPELEQIGGRVSWAGREISSLNDREFDKLRGGTFAYISQEPQPGLDPAFTIGSQLVEVVRHHEDLNRRDAKLRAIELLKLVELPNPTEIARARAHQLSGGMAQRVAIALALAGRPKLLIADEPTTALDVTVQAEILTLLKRLQEETGLAILLITHNWGVVADLCDRTVVMYAGEIVETAPVQDLFEQPLHPYTLGLLHSHPSLVAPGGTLAAMPGSVPAPGAWPAGCRFAPRCPLALRACTASEITMVSLDAGRRSRCIRVDDLVAEAVV